MATSMMNAGVATMHNHGAGVIGMRVSPGKMFPAHVSLGMRVPRTHIPRDACFPLVVHVPPAHISLGLGMRVSHYW